MAETVDLTITIDAGTAARIARIAKQQGTSVSQLVEASLRTVPDAHPGGGDGLTEWERALPPATRRLREIAHSGPMLGADGPVDWKVLEAELRAEDERNGTL